MVTLATMIILKNSMRDTKTNILWLVYFFLLRLQNNTTRCLTVIFSWNFISDNFYHSVELVAIFKNIRYNVSIIRTESR